MTDNCVSVGIGTECLQMYKEKKGRLFDIR